MRIWFWVILVVVWVSGCKSDKKAEEAIYIKVMAIHDEVMPKMGKLKALARTLNHSADSLASDTLDLQLDKINSMRHLAEDLAAANEHMMQWMRAYKQPEDGTPHGEVMLFFQEQYESVQRVRDDMNRSQKEAEKYILEN